MKEISMKLNDDGSYTVSYENAEIYTGTYTRCIQKMEELAAQMRGSER